MCEDPLMKVRELNNQMLWEQIKLGLGFSVGCGLLFAAINQLFYDGTLIIYFESYILLVALITTILRYRIGDWREYQVQKKELQKRFKKSFETPPQIGMDVLVLCFTIFYVAFLFILFRFEFLLFENGNGWSNPVFWIVTGLLYPYLRNEVLEKGR